MNSSQLRFIKNYIKTSVFVNTVNKDMEGIRFQIRSPQSITPYESTVDLVINYFVVYIRNRTQNILFEFDLSI